MPSQFCRLSPWPPACSASRPVEADDAAASELRALASNEVVGALSYGQTSGPVAYESTPTYRAFRFQGTAGDQVEAWVRSDDGDARAWIVTDSFKSVVSSDNADASTLNARLVATLKSTGTYYVVFRDKNMEDAAFTVSLANNGSSGGDGGSSTPVDPTSCSGNSAVPCWTCTYTLRTVKKFTVSAFTRVQAEAVARQRCASAGLTEIVPHCPWSSPSLSGSRTHVWSCDCEGAHAPRSVKVTTLTKEEARVQVYVDACRRDVIRGLPNYETELDYCEESAVSCE